MRFLIEKHSFFLQKIVRRMCQFRTCALKVHYSGAVSNLANIGLGLFFTGPDSNPSERCYFLKKRLVQTILVFRFLQPLKEELFFPGSAQKAESYIREF